MIHDWDEDQCLTILSHIRKAMKSNGRLFIVEMVLPEGDTLHPGKMLDMVMLLLSGGRERLASQQGGLQAYSDRADKFSGQHSRSRVSVMCSAPAWISQSSALDVVLQDREPVDEM